MVRVLIALAGALALAGPSAAGGNPAFALDPAQAAADLERSLSKFDARWVGGMTRQKVGQPTAVRFSGNGGRVEVTGTIPVWLNFTANAAEAKLSDGWLILAGTEQQPVEVTMPQHPHGKRKYLVRRIEVRLSDGSVRCPAGAPTVHPLK